MISADSPLHQWGWNDAVVRAVSACLPRSQSSKDLTATPAVGRVLVEHRGSFQLGCERGLVWARPTGRMRHQATDRRDLPAVGDWVLLSTKGQIHTIVPRYSVFLRKEAGERVTPQVIAANLDRVLVVTSANQEFNPRRLERYVAAVEQGGAEAHVVVNKTDLCSDVPGLLQQLPERLASTPVIQTSARSGLGKDELMSLLSAGQTLALVGSSGVGKSTLLNWLLGRTAQATSEVRIQDDHGRHTTTHRQMFTLPAGGCIIDTPGMRQFSLWAEDPSELAESFDDIESLAAQCRFADCQHAGQPGCQVQQALDSGQLNANRLDNYRRMHRELEQLRAKHRTAR